MRATLLLLATLALLCGCASRSIDQVSDDTVEIIPTGGGGADFLVMFLNRQTLMYNGDLASDRQRIVASRLKSTGCRDPRILRERGDEQPGSWAFGRKRLVYYSEWTCR